MRITDSRPRALAMFVRVMSLFRISLARQHVRCPGQTASKARCAGSAYEIILRRGTRTSCLRCQYVATKEAVR